MCRFLKQNVSRELKCMQTRGRQKKKLRPMLRQDQFHNFKTCIQSMLFFIVRAFLLFRSFLLLQSNRIGTCFMTWIMQSSDTFCL